MKLTSEQTNKSLRYSFLDGIFASGMIGFTQDYFTPFLLLLGGTARQVGALAALPNLFASLIQLKSPDITERLRSRKNFIVRFIFFQAIMLLPMVVIALQGKAVPVVFIILAVLFTGCGAVTMPNWGSLMSDLVPEDARGKYFGWRNRVLGLVIVAASFIAGFILHQMKQISVFYGFAAVFSAAFIFRLISGYFLNRMDEPLLELRREDHFTLVDFLSRVRESNFAKFVLFVSIMNFSVYLVSPFFPVLMLKDLAFSYLLYAGLTVTATLAGCLMISRWGQHADKVGNIKIIKFTAALLGLIPLFWLINRSPLFLFFVQAFAGFIWAGFNLCAANFIYDAVTPAKRARCIAYFNAFSGLAICAGALSGGFLLRYLPPLFGHKILMLCLISGVLRLIIGLYLPPRLKEVRRAEKVKSSQLFFSVLGIKPLLERGA